MGASINMHIEVKKDGQWMHYAAPSMLRDRQFFNLLCGFSEGFFSMVEPKGLPEDMSDMTKYCYQMSEEDHLGVHHQGWLSSDELRQLQQKLWDMNPMADRWEHDLEEEYFHCYIRGNTVSSHCGFDDSRLIFWFEN